MVTINGKEVEMKFDMGMARLFKKHTKKDLMNMGSEEYKDTEVIVGMLYAAAKRGNPDITADDIDSLTFNEMSLLSEVVTEGMTVFMPEPEEPSEDPLTENPQS
jgi:hypothetical protein